MKPEIIADTGASCIYYEFINKYNIPGSTFVPFKNVAYYSIEYKTKNPHSQTMLSIHMDCGVLNFQESDYAQDIDQFIYWYKQYLLKKG
jgi:hypothetical protein